MRRRIRNWLPALRIARRDALRARGRSALVLVMIGLPVLGIVCLDTLARTTDVSVREGLDRQLGSADALVRYSGSPAAIDQSPTNQSYTSTPPTGSTTPKLPVPTASTIRSVLGPGTRVISVSEGDVSVRTPDGLARPGATELDLRDPMAAGLFRLTAGRLPHVAGEAVVSSRLLHRGFSLNGDLTLEGGAPLRIVGIVESASSRDASVVVAPPGSLGLDPSAVDTAWLVSRPGGVDWPNVRALNRHALTALSREVVEHPPPAAQVSVQDGPGGSADAATVAVLGLIVAMALLEVVLLAGPAFAVGARRQQRTLALLAATGGRPRDVRRVVLASGVVLGSVAGLVGAAAGVAVAALALPVVQHYSTERFGPFDFSVRDITVIAACGLASAVLAALAPAVLAARQDVVAVLAGRRGEPAPRARSPIFGGVLLVAGMSGAVYGALKAAGGELYIAAGAITSVCGMVLLIPLVVSQLGRTARVLPLPARFAVRDAARHRGRTAPAVAAVAATVAGVVALGIGGASDAAQARAEYDPGAPMGTALVSTFDIQGGSDRWSQLAAAVRKELPQAQIRAIRGSQESFDNEAAQTTENLMLQAAYPNGAPLAEGGYAPDFGSAFLVGAKALKDARLDLSKAELTRALRTLGIGGVVIFNPAPDGSTVTSAKLQRESYSSDGNGETKSLGSWTVPATVVSVPGISQPAQAVLSESALAKTGFHAYTTALLVDGTAIGSGQEDAVQEAVTGMDPNAQFYVERGFHDDSVTVALLLLGVVGGVLVLGGTLTASFLALSDARPDFATLGAVGAAPTLRRFVAASYAGTIGLVGAVLGAAVGFIPGIAVTYPLTSSSWQSGVVASNGSVLPDHFVDVPWPLVLGIVVGLPLLTAGVVGLATRSRLPMVSRLA